MRITTVVFQKGEIVLGITEDDVLHMKAGYDIEPVDLRRNFTLGHPIPNVLKVIYVRDDEDYEDRLTAVGLDMSRIVPLDRGEELK